MSIKPVNLRHLNYGTAFYTVLFTWRVLPTLHVTDIDRFELMYILAFNGIRK
jgi:hypothetical protein